MPDTVSREKKRTTDMVVLSGGHERIRTAVRGFADLCLAARPRDPVGGTNIGEKSIRCHRHLEIPPVVGGFSHTMYCTLRV